MLGLFRRYQRSIYFIITFVVVVSFSFFGTFGTLGAGRTREVIAFNDVKGSTITRQELDELVSFISSDSDDKLLYGGNWGPNFLNDGVIAKNILQTGVGSVLAQNFADQIGNELPERLERQRHYKSYVHPQAPFVSAEQVWNYFSPKLNENLAVLRTADYKTSPTSQLFDLQAELYLAQKRFPAPLLKQMLLHQQRQYRWIKADEQLPYEDLSLFGYHKLSDWFGPRFMSLVGEFIINSAAIAEERGYKVSYEEALADLLVNAATSYQQNKQSPTLGVSNATEYFSEQLRRMNLSVNQAVSVWRQVLLFRRLFNDIGSAPIVDRFTFDKLAAYSREGVEGTSYKLPDSLHLADFEDLLQFEIYLRAVSKYPNQKKKGDNITLLRLPEELLDTSIIAMKAPSLLLYPFEVEVASFDKRTLEGRVPLQQMWNWQLEDKGWQLLADRYPILAAAQANDSSSRALFLEQLNDTTRSQIDRFSRSAIVDENPEWLSKALEEAPVERLKLLLSSGGQIEQLPGFKDASEIITLLRQASTKDIASETKLRSYTPDGEHYYKIHLLSQDNEPRVASFETARKQGLLKPLVDKVLANHYKKLKEKSPAAYQIALADNNSSSNANFKPLNQVRNEVAESFLSGTLEALRKELAQINPNLSLDRLASLRLLPYLEEQRQLLLSDSSAFSHQLANDNGSNPFFDQFRLIKEEFSINRAESSQRKDFNDLLAMNNEQVSSIEMPSSGSLSFTQINGKITQIDESEIFEKMMAMHKLLGNESQRNLCEGLCRQIKEKKAISLAFMEQSELETDSSNGSLPPEETSL